MDAYMIEYMVGAVIGSIISGAVVGVIPAICGAVKGKAGLAVGGFFACLAASLLLGLILSIPVCAVFLFFIFKKPKDVVAPQYRDPNMPDNNNTGW